MHKNQLVFFIIYCLLLIIFSFFVSGHQTDDFTFIHMNESGFFPNNIEIKQGETVMFENTGTSEHWPASNIHPTHRAYPGSDIALCGKNSNIFDACDKIEPGQTFSFQLSQPGTWRYHDHINPKLTGQIIVKPNPDFEIIKEDKKQESIFTTMKFHFLKLYYKLFQKLLDERLENVNLLKIGEDLEKEDELDSWLRLLGPEKIMDEIIQRSGGGSIFDCHRAAHQVGSLSYARWGSEVFSKGDASCHSGFYHGAMETFLSEEGTLNLPPKIDKICNSFESNFGIFECLHGVGHGIMAYENYDLPASIETCGQLRTVFAQRSCYGGAFMENVVAGLGVGALPGHETEWVSNDAHFPCTEFDYDELILYECDQMQTSWMLYLNQYNFGKVKLECMKAPENMRSVCFKSYGRDAAGHTLRDSQRISTLCNDVPKTHDYYDQCITGSVNVIIDFWGPALKDQATDLCKALPQNGKHTCYSLIANRLRNVLINQEDREFVCDSFEKEYQYLCGND